MKGLLIKLLTIASLTLPIACSHNHAHDNRRHGLESQLLSMINNAPGTVGIAFVSDSDTIVINNGVHYGMMSVFKLHQALAVCHELENRDASVDSVIHVSADEIDPDTWSPMLKEYGNSTDFDISIRSLINHAVISSDNNASNILFNRIVSPAATDSIVRAITGCDDFRILHTEHDMQLNHDLAYENAATAVDCATLIRRLWTKPIVSTDKQRRLRELLSLCNSAESRMALAVKEIPDACLAHRTGSGYTNTRGEITAVNDVGLILCPDGRQLALAILISDYPGAQHQADSTIASITRLILRTYYPQ